MTKKERWEELEKKYKELVEEIQKEFPDCYLNIGTGYMGKNGIYLDECFLCENYSEDRNTKKIYSLEY
jgi:hypothetical protein